MMGRLRQWALPARPLSAIQAAGDVLPQGLQVRHNCLVMPGATGLHDAQGRPLLESYLQRGPANRPEFPNGPPQHVQPLSRQPDAIPCGDVLFLAYVSFSHIGHLLTETAAWLWPLLDAHSSPLECSNLEMKIVLVSTSQSSDDLIPILSRLLAIPAERIQSTSGLERPLQCARALIPMPSMVNRRGIAAHHLQAVRPLMNRLFKIPTAVGLACLADAAASGSGAMVYLSRSQLPSTLRAIRGECELESCLVRLGWQVVHPEQLPIMAQLQILARARVIAGELGSALHLLMYLGEGLSQKIVIGLGVHGLWRDPRVLNVIEQLRLQSVRFWLLQCLGFCRRRVITPGSSGFVLVDDRRLLLPASWIADRMHQLASQPGCRVATDSSGIA